MKLEEAQENYKKDLARKNQLIEEAEQLRIKMEKAEEALRLKLAMAIKEGKIQSGGYIATGEESEEFMQTLQEMQEFEEELYAGSEKAAFSEARMLYFDKLLEIEKMDKEIVFAAAAVERAEKENELGAENE